MTEQTVEGTPEHPPPPIPCAECGSTDHTTGNHNGGKSAEATTQDGNHNGGRPA